MAKQDQWMRWPYWHSLSDVYGKSAPDDPNHHTAFFHAQPADENKGKESHMIGADPNVVTSPRTGRDYGVSIKAQINKNDRNDRRYSLDHVQEYTGIKETANWLSDAIDFMDATGTDEVRPTSGDSTTPEMDSTDLVQNLYDKRPQFPKTFSTLSRAQFVAEKLVNRRDANIPLTPRRQK
jgi:hypothetical protein